MLKIICLSRGQKIEKQSLRSKRKIVQKKKKLFEYYPSKITSVIRKSTKIKICTVLSNLGLIYELI